MNYSDPEFLEWAFGNNYALTFSNQLWKCWNDRHSNLFVCPQETNIYEEMKLMYQLWITHKPVSTPEVQDSEIPFEFYFNVDTKKLISQITDHINKEIERAKKEINAGK